MLSAWSYPPGWCRLCRSDCCVCAFSGKCRRVFLSDSAEQTEETAAEPVKEENPFKLDLSKIDFSDDDDEPAEEAEPVADNTADDSSSAEVEDDEDDGSSSISFKNFFKKK